MAQEVRTLATQLRPLALEDLGLAPALADYVEDWSKQTGVRADLHCNGLLNRSLPTDVENAVYRLVQEALTNVQKHAHAKSASIIVDRPAGHIRVLIEDDGCGFDQASAASNGHFGLVGMRERAKQIGGELRVVSAPGTGTEIVVDAPITV